jgi:hypothetical protein
VSGLRMGKGPPDQGAKSGPAQAPPAASARHFHDAGTGEEELGAQDYSPDLVFGSTERGCGV